MNENKLEKDFDLQVRYLYIFFFLIFWEFFGISLEFLFKIFLDFFWRISLEDFFWTDFFCGIFWEKFFGRIFLGGFLGEFFWEEFFGGNSTKSYLNIEEIDLFVKILDLRKGRRKFKSLEVRLQVHRT